jgi:hypothetical protein
VGETTCAQQPADDPHATPVAVASVAASAVLANWRHVPPLEKSIPVFMLQFIVQWCITVVSPEYCTGCLASGREADVVKLRPLG